MPHKKGQMCLSEILKRYYDFVWWAWFENLSHVIGTNS